MIKRKFSDFVFAICFCSITLCIIIYPAEALKAALDGLMLWFNVVCPALLPFFISVEVLIGLGVVRWLGFLFKPLFTPLFHVPGEASFAFFMSMASGYPVGARIVSRFRQDGLCTRIEGQRMLSLCSTSGPLFITGAVATGMLKSPAVGFLLLIAHYLSAFSSGFFMRFMGKPLPQSNRTSADLAQDRHTPVGRLLGDAIRDSVNLILMIGGYVIFFSVIAHILKITGLLSLLSGICCNIIAFLIPSIHLDQATASSLLVGFLEMTNGINQCASLSIPLLTKLMIISFMIGFGGLSVNAQVLDIIGSTDLRFDVFFLMKIFQGLMAAGISCILYTLFNAIPVFKLVLNPVVIATAGRYDWYYTLLSSFENMGFVFIGIAIAGIVLQALNFIFKRSNASQQEKL